MSTIAVNWLTSYQQLTRLCTLLQESGWQQRLPSILRYAGELNQQLQQLLDSSPAAAMAQLVIDPVDVPLIVKRAVKSWVLLALWSRLKHWTPSRRDASGVAGLLASCLADTDNIPPALQLAKILKNHQTGGLTTTLLAGCWHRLQHKNRWQVHRDSPLLTLALTLGKALQPSDTETLLLSEVMASCWYDAPDEFVLAELEQLAHLAPYLHLLGRLAQDPHDRYWLICQWEGKECLALPYRPQQQQCGKEVHQLATDTLQLLPIQPILPQHWLDRLAMPALPLMLHPTPKWLVENSLISKISYLELDKQVKLLEREPILAQYLLDNASNSNRRHTLVSRLRHALAIFGQNQLPLAVAHAELLQYLQRQANSQHQVLLQLQELFRHSLLLLGGYLAQPLSQQQAGVIAACCSAPLWHHPSIQAVPLSRTSAHGWLIAELAQQYLLEPVRSQRLSAALLQHYQQGIWAEAVLLQYQPANQQPLPLRHSYGLLLRLSWQLTFSIFNFPQQQSASTSLLQQISSSLHLPAQSLTQWQQLLLERAMPSCPLD